MSELATSTPDTINGNQVVAANIRAELGYADIGQGELAAAIEMSDMAMSRRMSEKYAAEFSAGEIARIAYVFGIEPGELFKSRERKTPRPGAGAGRRNLYLLDSGVGPAGIEPTTSTVESQRLIRPIINLFGERA